ncbi:hypothetical protein ECE50_005760 [Chitinophaga sp. Mgbs1]|uniref:Uncharacterized protein n=1 Tax=Chitinophaga solisilvae TaxID=1233460 RepID=A0A3S1CZJ6_9BACT|nr:hypothetical protein [Chitinophaga solisilvae]
MNKLTLVAACALLAMVACKQSDQKTEPVPSLSNQPTVEVKLNLKGDIITGETPMGRKAALSTQNKTVRDSVIYAVAVTQNYRPVALGLFNHLVDSIPLRVPTTGTISVSALVFKKGSGNGLYYSVDSAGRQYFPYPFYATLLNRMDTAVHPYSSPDSLNYLSVFADSSSGYKVNEYAELETHFGRVSFSGSSVPGSLTIQLKRVVFGVQYTVENFTAGKIKIDYSNNRLSPRNLTPGSSGQQYIYTADEFKNRDSLYNAPTMTVKWEKPDGSTVTIGSRVMNFKRNVLTTVRISLPVNNGSTWLRPITTENTWLWNENVNL